LVETQNREHALTAPAADSEPPDAYTRAVSNSVTLWAVQRERKEVSGPGERRGAEEPATEEPIRPTMSLGAMRMVVAVEVDYDCLCLLM
jgi:hypothetical protein